MATRIGGRLRWPWRAVDEDGRTLDVLVRRRCETEAAQRVFQRLLGSNGMEPARITTDRLGSYATAVAETPGMRSAKQLHLRPALPCNDR